MPDHEKLAHELARRFQEFPTVAAVALDGSQPATEGDLLSDLAVFGDNIKPAWAIALACGKKGIDPATSRPFRQGH
jgi:hypothetical protein